MKRIHLYPILLFCALCCYIQADAQTTFTPTACATESFTVDEGDIITDPSNGTLGGPGGDCTTTDSGDTGNYPNSSCVTTTTLTASSPITFTFDTFGIFSNFDWIKLTDVASGTVLYDNGPGGANDGEQYLPDLGTLSFVTTGNDLLIEFNATGVVNSCGYEATISTCVDPNLIDPGCICPGIFQPVIGCDCVEYVNDCEATCMGGVTTFAGAGGVVPWNQGDPCPFPLAPSTDGCTDATACNFDPNATNDDGSCFFVNDPCDDGDPNTINDIIDPGCACSGVVALTGCTDAAACNFNPGATVDDGSCLIIGTGCDDGDPNTTGDVIDANCVCAGTTTGGALVFTHTTVCNCAAGVDLDGDGLSDLAQHVYTIDPLSTSGPYTTAATNVLDATGAPYTNAALDALIASLDPMDGSSFSFTVYSTADGSTSIQVDLTDAATGQTLNTNAVSCTTCTANPIPTASEWGLLCLAIGLMITIGIYLRREETTLIVQEASR